MRIALVGAGSIGTIMGALLTKSGEDIVLIDVFKEHVDALNKNGATITGYMNETIPVKAITPDQMEGKYDLLIFLTKQSTLHTAITEAQEFMHDETVVLTLENGMPEDISRKIIPEHRVMGGGVEYGATWLEPGVSELTSAVSSLGITFGKIDGEITDKVKEIEKIFKGLGHSEASDNILGVRFTKLTDNTAFSGMSAALGCSFDKILDNNDAMTCIACIGNEASRIIRKLNVTPVELFGLHPVPENLEFDDQAGLDRAIAYWRRVYTPFKDLRASMLQDLEKGRKCEINDIDGKFAEKAIEAGIEAPFINKVVEVVTAIENGEVKLENAFNNLSKFNLPKFL